MTDHEKRIREAVASGETFSDNDLRALLADLDAMRGALEKIAADGWKKGYTFCHPEGCESPGIAIAALKGASHE